MSSAALLRHDSDEESDVGQARPAAAAATAGSGARMKELLASYYGMQQDHQRSGADMSTDVESTYFDSKRYVAGLLKNDKVETLLRKDDEMVREVKKLDSDMQMLVYENYNKFISATDTIRKMSQNVEGMETEMADLKSSMDSIASSSTTINTSLEGNRSKMDKLVRVRRLLQRLDFLFQLPQKLEEAVQEGQYAKAIRFFSMTKDILRKHSHVSSFGAIQRECEETVRRLQEKLQEEVNASDVCRETLVSHVDLLLRLGVDPAGLKDRYLEAHGRQLSGFLSGSKGALVEDRSVSLDACLGKLAEGFLPMLLRTVQLYEQLFQQSAAAAAAASQAAATSPLSTGQQQQQEHQQKEHQQEQDAEEGDVEAKAEGGQRSHEGLVALVRSSVDGFFGLLYAKVDQSLQATSSSGGGSGSTSQVADDQQQQQQQKEEEEGKTEGVEVDPVALGGVVAAVQQLVSDIEAVDPHVPQVSLATRAKEFAQEFKRGQVRRSFRVLCRSSLAVATSVVNAVKAGTPPEDILPETSETGYSGAGTFGGSSRHGSANSMSSGRRKRPGGGGGGGAEGLQYPALVDRAVATLMKGADDIVSGLRPLSRIDSSPGPLAEELRFGLWGVVLWLASALGIVAGVTTDASSCSILTSVEGREYGDNDASLLEQDWGNGAVSALREPLPLPSCSSATWPSGPNGNAAATAQHVEKASGAREGDRGEAATVGGATDGELVLLLACLCRGLGTTFVVRVPEILGRQIPLTLDQSVHAPPPSMHFSGSVHSTRSASSTLKSAATDRSMEIGEDEAAAVAAAGGGGPVLGRRRQLDAVRNRVSTASLSILEHYAETTGRRLADVLQAGLDAPPGDDGSGDWFSAQEPTGVGEAVLDALELAEDRVKEVCSFLGSSRTGTVSVTRSGDRDLRRGSSVALLSGGRNGRSGMGGGGGVRRDIDRIFEGSSAGGGGMGGLRGSSSSSGAGGVSFAADAMLAAVFRVALKGFGERARFITLPGPGFRQVHLDADFLRQVLPFYVAESQMLSSLDALLDQFLQSAADRSLDPTPMDTTAAGKIVSQALDGFN